MAELPNILRNIADLEKRIRKLETVRQPLGGDIIRVAPGNLASSGGIVLPAGSQVSLNVVVTPDDPTLTLWDIYETVHIDTDDASHRFADGVSLTAAQLSMRFTSWWDYESSNDATGVRVRQVVIKNEDSNSHTYYYYVRAYNMNIPFT